MKDFEGVDCDGLDKLGSQLVLGDDDVYYERKRTYYSGCMNLGPEYKRDEGWIKSFELARKWDRKT